MLQLTGLIVLAILATAGEVRASSSAASPDIYVRIGQDSPASVGCKELTPPKTTIRVTPKYPKSALKAGKRGVVLLVMKLSAEAKLVEIVVAKSDDPAFVEPAIAAVKKWIFEPAKCDGRPIPVIYNLTVNFK